MFRKNFTRYTAYCDAIAQFRPTDFVLTIELRFVELNKILGPS
jgi:hypothetical protein